MKPSDETVKAANEVLDLPELVQAIETEQFKTFLDHVPVAVVIGRILGKDERIIYGNNAFVDLVAVERDAIERRPWTVLDGHVSETEVGLGLGTAIRGSDGDLGAFRLATGGDAARVATVHTAVLRDDDGVARFRLAALVDVTGRDLAEREALERQIRDKDMLLKELQHRVKNNLALITALIRLEARQASDFTATRFDRLAGRVESLSLLYQQLSAAADSDEVDLGAYVSRIAAAAVSSHAPEGIRLNVQVDACPVSVNVAMPVGLIVNEVLTNALKHAFDEPGGTIEVSCSAGAGDCEVHIADDGKGMPTGSEWPQRGKLGALIVQSLRENANADISVHSVPGKGTRVVLRIDRGRAPERDSLAALSPVAP